MDKDKRKEVEEALIDFIKRVTKGETVSEAETAILPETVRVLIQLEMS